MSIIAMASVATEPTPAKHEEAPHLVIGGELLYKQRRTIWRQERNLAEH